MAITPDQQATLQLLLERGQSYSDLASLLGVEEPEVRSRARAALVELGGADPDRNVGLTDYLLGQADPIGRADASRHLREDAADHELATTLVERLREMFPAAQLPRLPGESRSGRFARRAAAGPAAQPSEGASPESRVRSGLSPSQTRLIAIAASAGVILIAIVLALTGAFGGDGDSAASSETTSSAASASDQQIQTVALEPVGGGNAGGDAVFGLATGDQPYVDVSIRGLDAAPQDETYVIWLMLTGSKGYPLSPISVQQDGSFQNRFSIPSAVLPVVARVRYVDVSIAPVTAIRKLVRGAIKNTSLVLDEPGKTVLRGAIPKASGGEQQQGSSGPN